MPWPRPSNPLLMPWNPRLAELVARVTCLKLGCRQPVSVLTKEWFEMTKEGRNSSRPLVAKDWHELVDLVGFYLSCEINMDYAKGRDKACAMLATLVTGPVPMTDIELACEQQAILEEMGYDLNC